MRPRPSSEFSAASIFAAAITLLSRVAGVAAVYGFFVILSRTHGATVFGHFIVATTAVQILSAIGRLGLDQGVMRVAGDHLAAGEEVQADGAIRLSMLLSFAGGTALTLLMLPLLRIESAYTYALRGDRLPILLAVPVVAAAQVTYAALRTRHHAGRASMTEGILRPVTMFVLAFAASAIWPSEKGFAVAFLVAWIVAAIAGAAFLRWRGRLEIADAKPLLRASLPLLAAMLLQHNIASLDVLALAAVAPPDVVGYYGAAQKIVQSVLMIVAAITIVFAPQVPAVAADREVLGALYRSTRRWILIAALPVLIITAALPELPLSLFGAEFVQAALPLTILSGAVFVNLVIGPAVLLMVMAARPIVLLRPYVISLATAVVMLAMFVPRYGAVGAATAMLITAVILRVQLYGVARREVGIRVKDSRSALLLGCAVAIAIVAKLLSLVAGMYVAAAAAMLAYAAVAVPVIVTSNREACTSSRISC